MNPFRSRWPIEKRSDWIGDQKIFNELEECIYQRVNAFILGVKGSGKTALLNCFFSIDYKREMAVKNRILIYAADLSTRSDGEDICNYLADRLKYAVKRLLGKTEEQAEIMEELESINSASGETRLQYMIEFLHEEYGYFVVLIMDNFELFTSSTSITIEHHEKLRSLIESRMLQCIVATDYDLSKDSLPWDVKGSYLVQKFTHSILAPAFSEEDALSFIKEKQKGCEIQLEDNVIRSLFKLSGGIPWMLEAAAECAYGNIEKNGGELNRAELKDAVYQACLPIMESWCKLLTAPQTEVLTLLAAQIEKNSIPVCRDFAGEPQLQNAVAALKFRGILRQAYNTDQFGNVIRGGDYYVCFNSLLFQLFCSTGRMKEIAGNNPLAAEKPGEKFGQPVQQIIQNYNFYEGSKANLSGAQDYSQTIHADNVQINQGITPSEILSLLQASGDSRQLFAQQLSAQIQKNISQDMLPRLTRGGDMGEEEFAQQYDEEYDRFGQQLIQEVQVDEEDDLVNVTQDELETLDLRFEEARRRCRANVTDELLEHQSERCQFYIKLSVVVEDALDFPGAFVMNDFSPQLVLYGKALEQALRDNLYELFHREEVLSIYDTKKHIENAASGEVFKNKALEKTYIGNYVYLILYKKDYLGGLCMNQQISWEGIDSLETWKDWWSKFQTDIDSAREIRNLADHADQESPDKIKLNQMCSLLFGEEDRKGILDRMRVGKSLAAGMFPPAIPAQIIEELTGTVCEMECTQRKANGGLKGKLCDGGYVVNISPRKVKRYRESLPEQEFNPVGTVFRVKILEYKIQNETEFFSAEIEG